MTSLIPRDLVRNYLKKKNYIKWREWHFLTFAIKILFDTVVQTTIGFNGVKSTSVYFYGTRNTPFVASNSVVTYQIAPLNIGGGFNTTSGIFTAPVSGRYHFSFNAAANFAGMHYVLLLNGVQQVSALNGQVTTQQAGLQVILNLVPGDQVSVTINFGGIIFDNDSNANNMHFTQFIGQLLEQDINF